MTTYQNPIQKHGDFADRRAAVLHERRDRILDLLRRCIDLRLREARLQQRLALGHLSGQDGVLDLAVDLVVDGRAAAVVDV